MVVKTQDLKNQILEKLPMVSTILTYEIKETKELERKLGIELINSTLDESIEFILRKDLTEHQLKEIDKFIDFVIDNYLEDEFEVCEEFPPMVV